MPKPVIHIFDLDRTITRLPTYTPFLLAAARMRAPWRLLLIPCLIPFLLGYVMKLLGRKHLKQTMHAVMLGSTIAKEDVTALAEKFAQNLMADGLFVDIISIIERAQTRGERVIIATASHIFYVSAIAAKLGISEIVATGSVWNGDMLTPQISGENCYGPAKLAMIVAYFSKQNIDRAAHHIIFYSDHISDLPTFEWCDEPVAKNASKKLHAVALARGWQILA